MYPANLDSHDAQLRPGQRPVPAAAGGPDQRQQLRFAQGERVRARLRARDHHAEARVQDLSLGGAGLVLEPDRWRGPARAELELRIEDRVLGEVGVDLVHTGQASASRLGVRYHTMGRRFLQGLCGYLVTCHSQSASHPRFLEDQRGYASTDNRLRIRQLVVHCCRRRQPLRVCAEGRTLGLLRPSSIQGSSLLGQLEGMRVPAVGKELTLAHASSSGLGLLPTRFEGATEGIARVALPERLLEGGTIRLGRLVAGEDFPVLLEFVHPQLAGKLVRKRVRELSFGGVRFDLEVARDLLAPGTVIDAAVLRLPGGRSLPCRCQVRHTLALEDGSYQCGVELLDFRGAGRQVWIEQILLRLNPEVEEASPFTLHEAWEVFDRSGYLEEKPSEGLAALREPFLETWQQVLRTREGGRLWLHRGGRPAVGTIATTRIYSSTWLVHHLAVDGTIPAARKLIVLADLAPRSAAQWLAGAHPDGHLLVYYDASKSFNEAPYTAFFATRARGREVSLRSLRLREHPVDAPAKDSPSDERLWARPATGDELERISADLRARDGELSHRAFDHTPAKLVQRAGVGSSVQRWREVLVVGDGASEALGFALVEGAASALNVFALYDTVRLVLWQRGPGSSGLLRRIIREVRDRYRARGRRSFLVLTGEGDAECPEPAAFEASAVQAVSVPELLPFWLRHLERLWGQR